MTTSTRLANTNGVGTSMAGHLHIIVVECILLSVSSTLRVPVICWVSAKILRCPYSSSTVRHRSHGILAIVGIFPVAAGTAIRIVGRPKQYCWRESEMYYGATSITNIHTPIVIIISV